MKTVSIVLAVGSVLFGAVGPLFAPTEKWESMFDGKSLAGWTPKIRGYKFGENYADTFRVKDGAIQVRYDQYEGEKFDGKFGHLFYKVGYSHYRMRLEYRFVGKQLSDGPGWANRNSGIMFHGQSGESMRIDQDFPVSIEYQLLGGLGDGERSTANLCTPGTNVVYQGKLWTQHCTNSNSPTFDGDQWVKVEVEVHGGGVVKHWVNGVEVMHYSEPQYDPSDADAKALLGEKGLLIEGGSISLQSESSPVDFRNIEILRLKE